MEASNGKKKQQTEKPVKGSNAKHDSRDDEDYEFSIIDNKKGNKSEPPPQPRPSAEKSKEEVKEPHKCPPQIDLKSYIGPELDQSQIDKLSDAGVDVKYPQKAVDPFKMEPLPTVVIMNTLFNFENFKKEAQKELSEKLALINKLKSDINGHKVQEDQ